MSARAAREQHAAVMAASVRLVSTVDPDDLARPTPCAGWDLRRLLAHMTGQNHGFAAAATVDRTDREAWRDHEGGASPVRAYAESAARVVEAFGAPGFEPREMWLPEIAGGISVPAPLARSFHLLDYVVHTWDVARALGAADPTYDDDVVAAVLETARLVPDDARRHEPGALFGPVVAVEDVGPMAQVLALTGRRGSDGGSSRR